MDILVKYSVDCGEKDVVTSFSVVHCKMYCVQFKENITARCVTTNVTPVGKISCKDF